ncbi:hypothetical protein C0Q70_06950 [Pomacea canaliculata]|uniref:Large ribosomal subunit protein mL50 n=1 Tax=Pomacea canaliculata TaxID=400727 RepID=A0A2T7PDN8_POMCA|nr:hypothetical protein C0Q70_06950 [Pomacea canaliculata]
MSYKTWMRTAFFWKKKDERLPQDKVALEDERLQTTPTTKILKKKIGLQTVAGYTPPADVEERVEQITREVCGDIKDWKTYVFENNNIKFKILTRLIAEFDHNIPNVDLASLHSIGDALAFFNKPVKDTSKYEDLAKLDLPPNVHIQLEALRFDPATDTMFGGISAFPDRPTIVKSIRYRKKYGKND